MATETAPRKSFLMEMAGVLARWLLGWFFVYMGFHKVLHPVDFLKLVRQYEIVNSPLAEAPEEPPAPPQDPWTEKISLV